MQTTPASKRLQTPISQPVYVGRKTPQPSQAAIKDLSKMRDSDETNLSKISQESKLEMRITKRATLMHETKECRVCLEGDTPQKPVLISPCCCQGSVKYIHQECFVGWAQTSFNKKNREDRAAMMNKGFKCELCKHPIQIIAHKITKCHSREEISIQISSKTLIFILFIFFILINSSSLVFLASFIAQRSISFDGSSIFIGSVVVFALVFLSTALPLGLVFFVKEFFVHRTVLIEGFQTQKEPQESPRPRREEAMDIEDISEFNGEVIRL